MKSRGDVGNKGQMFFTIEHLPPDTTWQDLKDLIQRRGDWEQWHGLRTDRAQQPSGSFIWYVRMLRRDQTLDTWNFLTKTCKYRGLRVHLWDISTAQPRLLQCNCEITTMGPSLYNSHAFNVNEVLASKPDWQTSSVQIPNNMLRPLSAPVLSQQQSISIYPIQSPGSWHGPEPSFEFARLPYLSTAIMGYSFNGNGHSVASYNQNEPRYSPLGQTSSRHGVKVPDRGPTYTRHSPNALPINTSNGIVRKSKTNVFVHGLRSSITANDVRFLFSQAGEILKCELPMDRKTGKPKGYASVLFKTESEANNAIRKFHGFDGGYAQSKIPGGLTVRLDKTQPAITDISPTIVRSHKASTEPRPS